MSSPLRVPTMFYDLINRKPLIFRYLNNVNTFSEYFMYNKIPYRVQTKYSYLNDDIKQDMMIFFVYDRKDHAKVPTQVGSIIEEIFDHLDDDLKPFIREIKIKDLK